MHVASGHQQCPKEIEMLLAFLAASALIQAPSVSPLEMRRAPTTYTSDRSLIELQACITRYWAQAGTVTPIPLTDGVTLDFYTKGMFGPGKAKLSFVLKDLGSQRLLGVDYRHPLSAKSARRALDPAVKICSPESLISG
jgi:hypothetical protein